MIDDYCNCKYKKSFNTHSSPMMIIDAQSGEIEDANEAACQYYNYSKEALLKLNITDINALSQKEIYLQMDNVKTNNVSFLRFKHKLANGQVRDVEVHSSYFENDGKKLLFSIVHDVEDKAKLEREYLLNKVYFDGLFNNSPEAIVIVDSNFKIINTNERFKNVFQYDLEEIEKSDITSMLVDKQDHDLSIELRQLITEGKFISEEVTRKRRDGSSIEVLLLGFPLFVDNKISGAYFIYTDISQSKKQKDQISILTYRDPITGLFNRRFFLENLKNEIIKSKNRKTVQNKQAVVILNVNEFQEINSALGTEAGETILKEFASRLRKSLDNSNLITRFINDEFAIILPNITELSQIRDVTNKIIKNVEDVFIIGFNDFDITTNIGVALYPDDGDDCDNLVRKAKIAMEESKRRRDNRVIKFEKAYDSEVQETFWLKRDLISAIRNDELFLNYQPIHKTSNKEMVAAEALLRWQHPEYGLIPPLKFIPIAEKTEMIHTIGEIVLRNACSQNKQWQDQGYKPIVVSVNVSVIQFEKPGFVEMVKSVLKETKLEAKYLQLEITETYFSKDYEVIKDSIEKLSNIGISFAIDDFGTEYSSLGQLSELSINNLKIDRTFISNVDKSINNKKIVKAIIALADSLDINLTAEGVEREEEFKLLQSYGCMYVQGYLFSKPVEALDFEKLLHK